MKHYLSRLQGQMKAHWDEKAICDFKGKEFTFSALAEKIERFHILFELCGVKKGDRIALCAKNSSSWAISFLSVNTSGATIVPILADFTPESVNSLVDHSESIALFTDTDIWKKLDITKMPNIRFVISVTDFSILYSKDETVKNAIAKVPEEFASKYPMGFTKDNISYPVKNGSDLALINYTSGTTSAPKGVMITFDAFSSNVEFAIDKIPLGAGNTMVSMLPMAHMYGMMFEFIYPLCSGATIYYLGATPTPTLLLGAMKEVKPKLIITVPLVMEKIYKSSIAPVVSKPAMKVLTSIPGVRNALFNTIKKKLLSAFGGNVTHIIMGGAALNPDVEDWFRKLKLPYTVGYGMTEFAPLLAYQNPPYFVKGSCGVAADRIEVRIDSEDPANIVGEIQARGVSAMIGYYKNEEATNAAFTEDGWVKTGDLGVIDKQGNIFIRGRSKNMILSSNGQNIYPEEIEAVINAQPYVLESVLVNRGGTLVALTYFDKKKAEEDGLDAEGFSEYLNTMLAAINKKMPVYSKVAHIEPVETPFEKTPKMSIKRFLYS
ncbi:MAG: AMP-binding protein [Bacteroidales bacterium]|nr:AMP-binding protein [Bacteroidales bacterium]